MTTALVIPGLETDAPWQVRDRADSAARALADRHYSRRSLGFRTLGPPGRVLVLVTPCERAVWVTHWPLYPQDGLDAWRCTLFRNEGAGLSSALIRAAMDATAQLWADRPADGWVTFVDPRAVASSHPGWCFLCAGWWKDRTWKPGRWAPYLRRLRAA